MNNTMTTTAAHIKATDKIIVFDMDGTLFDFYGVENWHHCLYETMDPTPYAVAKPMYNKKELNTVVNMLRQNGWTIIVNTWLSRVKTPSFHAAIRDIKLQRLAEIEFPYDYFIATEYGVDKQSAIRHLDSKRQIIVDDNVDIREAWIGETIDATQDIIPALLQLASADSALPIGA